MKPPLVVRNNKNKGLEIKHISKEYRITQKKFNIKMQPTYN